MKRWRKLAVIAWIGKADGLFNDSATMQSAEIIFL